VIIKHDSVRYCTVRFQVFMAAKSEIVFWVVTLCSVVVGYQRFQGPHYLHPEDDGSPKRWYPTTALHDVTIRKTTT